MEVILSHISNQRLPALLHATLCSKHFICIDSLKVHDNVLSPTMTCPSHSAVKVLEPGQTQQAGSLCQDGAAPDALECQVCALTNAQNTPIKPSATHASSRTGPPSQPQNDGFEKDDSNFVNILKARRITLYLHYLRNTEAFLEV